MLQQQEILEDSLSSETGYNIQLHTEKKERKGKHECRF